MSDRLIWDEISLEVISAARLGLPVRDFELQCHLAPFSNEKSFLDRLRVADSLIQEKVIYIDDGHLRLSQNAVPESLVDKLLLGSEVAWKILGCISPTPKALGKLDQDLLNKIGKNGEFAVIAELKNQMSESEFKKVLHVSLYDDSAGFDIQSPSSRNTEDSALLEVKTSVRPGGLFTFYISANEARIGRLNRNWFIVGVESSPSGFSVFGHLPFDTFSDLLPLNQSESCEWQSARVSASKKAFRQGLP